MYVFFCCCFDFHLVVFILSFSRDEACLYMPLDTFSGNFVPFLIHESCCFVARPFIANVTFIFFTPAHDVKLICLRSKQPTLQLFEIFVSKRLKVFIIKLSE
jgi:hypothetical protein